MSVATMPVATGSTIVLNTSEVNEPINLNTELRHLPPWVRSRLGQLVDDGGRHWQAVMADIPQSPPWYPGMPLPKELHYERKYSAQDCRLLENALRSGGVCATVGSGINLLLEEWGCSGRKRPTVGDLINLLHKNNLLSAAMFLKRDVLRESSTDGITAELKVLDSLMEDCKIGHDTRHHSATYTELDRLLQQGPSQPASTDTTNPINGTNSNSEDDSKRHNIVFQDESLIVPHLPYKLLANITKNFSDEEPSLGGHKLGEGAFGIVYRATISSSRVRSTDGVAAEGETRQIAIKKLTVTDERICRQFKEEVEVFSLCRHDNLLPLEGYSCDGPELCLLYALMPNGNLQDRLGAPDGALSWRQRLQIAEGIAAGLAYLHTFMAVPKVHRDIKSANILLDEDMRAKIGDFGLVRVGGSGLHTKTQEVTTTVFGTSAYMSPEAFRGDVSVKLDTFSYGVVLLELLTGLPPYDEHRDGRDIISHVGGLDEGAPHFCDPSAAPWPEGLPQHLLGFAMKCLEEKKGARPTMVQALALCRQMTGQWH